LIAALIDQEASQRIRALRVEGWDDVQGIRKGMEKWLQENKLGTDYDMIMLDSVTELQEMALKAILRDFPSKQKDGLPEQQHYGMLRERMRQILYALTQSKFGVYVTAQAMLVDIGTKDSPQTMWLASLIGKTKNEIKHLFDWEFFSRKLNNKFELVTEETTDSFGKSRGVTLPRIVPFNLDELFAQWGRSIR